MGGRRCAIAPGLPARADAASSGARGSGRLVAALAGGIASLVRRDRARRGAERGRRVAPEPPRRTATRAAAPPRPMRRRRRRAPPRRRDPRPGRGCPPGSHLGASAEAYEILTGRLPRSAPLAVAERPGALPYLPRRWALVAGAGRVALEAA